MPDTLFSSGISLFPRIDSLLAAKRFPVPVFRELCCQLIEFARLFAPRIVCEAHKLRNSLFFSLLAGNL
jgi:hypothetical protein